MGSQWGVGVSVGVAVGSGVAVGGTGVLVGRGVGVSAGPLKTEHPVNTIDKTIRMIERFMVPSSGCRSRFPLYRIGDVEASR